MDLLSQVFLKRFFRSYCVFHVASVSVSDEIALFLDFSKAVQSVS